MAAHLSPAIILVRPQLGQNIGMTARAMANFALTDLRLVAPRDGWPNPEAGPAAAGADHVLDGSRIYERVADAAADCVTVLATTVRPRDSRLPVVTPQAAAVLVHQAARAGERTAILFGPERSGLTADDIAAAHGIVTCPVNPGFGSLNLAQAVLLLAYEWFQAQPGAAAGITATLPEPEAASAGEVSGLIEHLAGALEAAGYFHPPARAPAMRRTLAGVFARARLTSQDLRTLRGVVSALEHPRPR
ncbi:MAG: RNA methyltransferase [Pararhodobacter sp.]